jgi:hypothetical protein
MLRNVEQQHGGRAKSTFSFRFLVLTNEPLGEMFVIKIDHGRAVVSAYTTMTSIATV